MAVPILIKRQGTAQAHVPPIGTLAATAKSRKMSGSGLLPQTACAPILLHQQPQSQPDQDSCDDSQNHGYVLRAPIPRTVPDHMRMLCGDHRVLPRSNILTFQLMTRFLVCAMLVAQAGYAFGNLATAVRRLSQPFFEPQYFWPFSRSNVLAELLPLMISFGTACILPSGSIPVGPFAPR